MALPALKFFPRPRELTLRGGWLPVPALPHPTAAFLAGLPTNMDEARAALDRAQAAEEALKAKLAPEGSEPVMAVDGGPPPRRSSCKDCAAS